MDEKKPAAAGLFYRRTDGVEVSLGTGEQWVVTLPAAGGVQLRRYLFGIRVLRSLAAGGNSGNKISCPSLL